jgi:hypothetical protein
MRLWNVDFYSGDWDADVMIVMAETSEEAGNKAREYLIKTMGALGARAAKQELIVTPTEDRAVAYIGIEIN